MRFSVFALSAVPDTVTTRQLFGLDDLDDKSVSKVLFHRRKQQTGSSEVLRWDQKAIAGLTLIQHSIDGVKVHSMNYARHSEEEMLHAFFKTVLNEGRMVSWGGKNDGIPLIHFRTLKYGISYPPYWKALKKGDMHTDICEWLSPPSGDSATLDETARKLGFPGLLGGTEHAVTDAWLQDRKNEVQAFSDISALNSYLLALRMYTVAGEMTPHDMARAKDQLIDELGKREEIHLKEFLAAWSDS